MLVDLHMQNAKMTNNKSFNIVKIAQSCLRPPWAVACQAPLSLEFSRQEYWSGYSFPSPGDISDPGIEPRSPTWQADSLLSESPGGDETKSYRYSYGKD